MNEDSPINIFGSSAKKEKYAKDNTSNKTPPKSISGQMNPWAHQDPAIAGMLEKIRIMRAEIDTKIEETTKSHGLTKEQLWDFISDPHNFTPEQWAILQNERSAYREKVAQTLNQITSTTKAIDSTITEKKMKFAGARRNWISTY